MPERERNQKKPRKRTIEEGSSARFMPDRESSIGRFIRERRKANGMTQPALGELAGVGTRFISELERGKPTLRMDAVNRVLAVFGKILGIADAPRKVTSE